MPAMDKQNALSDNPEQRESVTRDPDAIEMSDEELAANTERLDQLGQSLAKTRSDAIDARGTSGIENEWREDQEHYEGIDDVNRGELASWRSKPAGQAAITDDDDDDTGSTVFFNITRSYCDTAAARVGDMLLPTDDKGWAIEPTPIPEMVAIADGKIPTRVMNQIKKQTPKEQVQGVIDQVIEQEKEMVTQAKEVAKRASTRIEDWHVESQYNAEMRKVIEDCSQIGTGIMKGPIPEMKKRVAYIDGRIQIEEVLQPVSLRVDPFNCFPDKSCGQNIHNGNFHWERDDISKRSLMDLADQPGYLEDQIRACIEEGPHSAVKQFTDGDGGTSEQLGLVRRDKTNMYEIWYYYGRVEKIDLEAAGVEIPEDEMDIKIDAHLVIVNNHVIRASLNHLDTGEFPYDYMPWQQRVGVPWGIGVSRQIRTPQRVLNGAGRNLMDNAGLAGGPMWIFNQGMVEPMDGIYELAPRKGWLVNEDAESEFDVSKAFTFIKMDIMQTELNNIIVFGMQMAEHISGLPSLLQGQESKNQETMGGQQMRRNDGSTVLRRIARLYDDKITTPHIRRYYSYLLQYGEDDEKGDFTIKARGSSALVERDLQNQSIIDMADIVSDPTFGLDKKKWAKQWLMSQRLDPANFEFDDDKWQGVLERLSAPQDSTLELAQMKTEFEAWKFKATLAADSDKMNNDNIQKERDREIDIAFKTLDKDVEAQLATMKASGTSNDVISKIKASLAETVITLQTQVKLAGQNGTAPEVANPVVEPVGRAPDGESFQK